MYTFFSWYRTDGKTEACMTPPVDLHKKKWDWTLSVWQKSEMFWLLCHLQLILISLYQQKKEHFCKFFLFFFFHFLKYEWQKLVLGKRSEGLCKCSKKKKKNWQDRTFFMITSPWYTMWRIAAWIIRSCPLLHCGNTCKCKISDRVGLYDGLLLYSKYAAPWANQGFAFHDALSR